MGTNNVPQWIDGSFRESVGDLLFLREVRNTTLPASTGTRWTAADVPPRTNVSGQPRIAGWCGETDNRSVYARGLVRVTKVTNPRDGYPRLRVAQVRGQELAEALDRLGYPELTEEA